MTERPKRFNGKDYQYATMPIALAAFVKYLEAMVDYMEELADKIEKSSADVGNEDEPE